VIVTKDSDFHERAQFSDPRPKIVWIKRPNCSASGVEAVLRRHRNEFDRLQREAEIRYLILVWQRGRGNHSITRSARARSDCGMVSPIALAARMLMTSSNVAGCSTGRSAGLAPLRMRSAK